MSELGQKLTWPLSVGMSAFASATDIERGHQTLWKIDAMAGRMVAA
jgi:hypothetical protein